MRDSPSVAPLLSLNNWVETRLADSRSWINLCKWNATLHTLQRERYDALIIGFPLNMTSVLSKHEPREWPRPSSVDPRQSSQLSRRYRRFHQKRYRRTRLNDYLSVFPTQLLNYPRAVSIIQISDFAVQYLRPRCDRNQHRFTIGHSKPIESFPIIPTLVQLNPCIISDNLLTKVLVYRPHTPDFNQ